MIEKRCGNCKYQKIDCFKEIGNCISFSNFVEKDRKKHTSIEEVEEKPRVKDSLKPSHYNSGKFDVISFCMENNIEFWCGNVIKYCVRAGKKDKNKEIEDLKKAIEYINRRIKYLEGDKQ